MPKRKGTPHPKRWPKGSKFLVIYICIILFICTYCTQRCVHISWFLKPQIYVKIKQASSAVLCFSNLPVYRWNIKSLIETFTNFLTTQEQQNKTQFKNIFIQIKIKKLSNKQANNSQTGLHWFLVVLCCLLKWPFTIYSNRSVYTTSLYLFNFI